MKSPLKAKPLRNPGESLSERLIDLVFDHIVLGLVLIISMFPVTVLAWWSWHAETIFNPFYVSAIAAVFVLFGLFTIHRALREAKHVKLGLAGEKAVGQFLESLRAQGAIVFHDIVGDKFNLDHVVIARSGIYVIETKTMSKPATGKPELTYDGTTIYRGGKPLMGDPVTQVSAASSWLREILHESTGRTPIMRPVVVFPGWYINNTMQGRPSVWVLNPKALPTFLKNEEDRIAPEDVHLFAFHLCRYVRAR